MVKTTDDQKPDDDMKPETIDDMPENLEQPDVEQVTEEVKPDDDKPAPGAPPHDDVRNNIAKGYSDRVKDRGDSEFGEMSDDAAQYGADNLKQSDDDIDDKSEELPGENQNDGKAEKNASQNDDPLITIKVDGVEQQIKQSEMVANYQMNSAADNRLRDANKLLDEVKQQRADRDQGEPKPKTDQTEAGQSEPTEAETKAKYVGMAEKLQLGDTEEAAEILENLDRGKTSQDANDQEISAVVREALSQEREATALQEAQESFAEEFDDIAQDPNLRQVALNMGHLAMVDDLKQAGITEDRIQEIPSPAHLEMIHREMRVNNVQGVRQLPEIYNFAGQQTMAWRDKMTGASGQEHDAASDEKRLNRKRNIKPQPKTAIANRNATPDPKPKTRGDAVTEMRKMRGQAVA